MNLYGNFQRVKESVRGLVEVLFGSYAGRICILNEMINK